MGSRWKGCRRVLLASIGLLAVPSGIALAQQAPVAPPAAAVAPRVVPTLSLDAQARASVPNDEMLTVLATERDGPQVGPLNDAVIAQLQAAIAEARAVDGVRARLGSMSTQPNYTREGQVRGWRVRGEVILESTRMQPLAALAGRLAERMQLAAVTFRLSDERRRAEERRLVGEAARAFRTRAAEAAAAFGYAGYELKELALVGSGASPGPRPMTARSLGGAEAASMPLPVEGGDSDVVVSVSGTVELRP